MGYHIAQRIIKGLKIRVEFLLYIARKESEFLTGFNIEPVIASETAILAAEPARLALLVVFVERLVEAERFVFEAFAFEAFASCWPFG